jgi:hypothetical protein
MVDGTGDADGRVWHTNRGLRKVAGHGTLAMDDVRAVRLLTGDEPRPAAAVDADRVVAAANNRCVILAAVKMGERLRIAAMDDATVVAVGKLAALPITVMTVMMWLATVEVDAATVQATYTKGASMRLHEPGRAATARQHER